MDGRKKRSLNRSSRIKQKAFFRGKLLDKRRQALQRLHHELNSVSVPVRTSGDFADMASSNSEMDTMFEISTVESDALARIDHALSRIDEGTYGICEDCGETIPHTRLRILPFASTCVKCQTRNEREDVFSEEGTHGWGELGAIGAGDAAADFAGIRGGRPGG